MKSAPANIHKKCFKRSSFRDIFFNCLSVTISFKVWACVTLGIYFGILVFPRTSFLVFPNSSHYQFVETKRNFENNSENIVAKAKNAFENEQQKTRFDTPLAYLSSLFNIHIQHSNTSEIIN